MTCYTARIPDTLTALGRLSARLNHEGIALMLATGPHDNGEIILVGDDGCDYATARLARPGQWVTWTGRQHPREDPRERITDTPPPAYYATELTLTPDETAAAIRTYTRRFARRKGHAL